MLFVVRPLAVSQSGFRLVAREAQEAVRLARQMEDRGMEVEIVDPAGQVHRPDDLDDEGAAAPRPEQAG